LQSTEVDCSRSQSLRDGAAGPPPPVARFREANGELVAFDEGGVLGFGVGGDGFFAQGVEAEEVFDGLVAASGFVSRISSQMATAVG
jgi:hypothetical protein